MANYNLPKQQWYATEIIILFGLDDDGPLFANSQRWDQHSRTGKRNAFRKRSPHGWSHHYWLKLTDQVLSTKFLHLATLSYCHGL